MTTKSNEASKLAPWVKALSANSDDLSFNPQDPQDRRKKNQLYQDVLWPLSSHHNVHTDTHQKDKMRKIIKLLSHAG